MYRIINSEKTRQRLGLELIASENFTSRAVMEGAYLFPKSRLHVCPLWTDTLFYLSQSTEAV